jgi:hypothetical protein
VIFGEADFCPNPPAAQAVLAPYLVRGGEQVLSQPVSLQGVEFYGYLLPSDISVLQALCDRYLNLPGQNQVRYQAFVPRVLLSMDYIARVQSLMPPDAAKGWSPENEAAFWVPVLAFDQTGWSLPRLVWFQPYLYVDNAWATEAGREIYGFAKEMATFTGAAGPIFSANALAIKHFGNNSQAVVTRLIDVRYRNPGAGHGPARPVANPQEALRNFVRALGGGCETIEIGQRGREVELAGLLSPVNVPLVFLKEFRDAANGTQTCYQAIVEATATVGHVGSLGTVAGPFLVTVTQCDSHPMIDELGLPRSGAPTADTVLVVDTAWQLNFDFTIGNGRIIWQA